jgi:alpha-L-rhamnosidase
VRATFLRTEYLVDPIGIDETRPRFSWLLESDRPGDAQTAYQVVIDGVWDSGRAESDRLFGIEYDGPVLTSRQRCVWRVRVWDGAGQSSDWSAPASFEMGLLDSADWSGSWIAPAAELRASVVDLPDGVGLEHWGKRWSSPPPPFLRRRFSVGAEVVAARAYVTARGLYELHINGARVGDDVFTPGWTDYRKRIQYQVYDVTAALRSGDNAVGLVLGDGWWAGKIAWFDRLQNGTESSALMQLEIELADGTVERIVTDAAWRAAVGPCLWSDLLMGEAYDARRALPGWDQADFDDSSWTAAAIEAPLPGEQVALVATRAPAVRRTQELVPQSVTEPTPGAWVFDLGQNMVGRVRLNVRGPAGTVVRIRHAEMCNPDGTIYTQNLRHAAATDFFVLAGVAGGEVYEPAFTFHGFRYVEVTGLPEAPDLAAVTGVVLQSDLDPTGTFECSNELVNQLQRNIVWGQRGNFLEAPTDCPQRDERLGWLGDAQVFAATASWNMDVAPFFTKWMQDVIDGQHSSGLFPDVAPLIAGDVDRGAPAWADAGVIVPWTVYRWFGDERILERCFPAVAKFVDGLAEAASDELVRLTPGKYEYGDWLANEAATPKDLIATCYFAESTRLAARMAEVLGRDDDAKRYQALWEDIRRAFNEGFVTPAGRVVGHTQTSYVLALVFNLLDEAGREIAMRHLVADIKARADHLSTGFLGVGHLLPVLADGGAVDVAYKLLLQDTFPSWLYSIKQGATTIWERWDGWTDTAGFQTWHMNSFNHYSLGSVGAWLYRDVAGIGLDPAVAGYRHAVIRPRPGGGLTWARGSYRSVVGTFASAWRLSEDGAEFSLDVTVPVGATAAVHLPDGSPPVAVAAGTHSFSCPLESSASTGDAELSDGR